MNCKIGKLATLLAAAVLALGFASSASAQIFTGRIDVTIEDSTGGRLPGVNVDLTGPVNQSQVSDSQGQAHFLNLPVGTYTVKAALQGFNTYSNNQVVVATGAATPLSVRLGVAGTQETVNVTAATPIIDVKRDTTTTNVTLDELQNIPSARDPWVVMQTVPTIYVDRVNVGGSESGQQSNYLGKGSVGTDNTWNIDGVPVTDMGATGSTPTYYDFDMFQEMSITTGGADAQNPTPGVQLNLVLKKGTNTPHGNARYFFENNSLQGNNMDPALAKTIGGSSPACVSSGYTKDCGNRTDYYKDYGGDIGGPILKDKLWAWGTIAETHPRVITLAGTPDETILRNYAFKADGQMNDNVRGNFTFFEGNKLKYGRGASPLFPPETTWDQSGPTKYYKGEGNFVVGQNLFLAARYAYISGGFALAPEGGNKPWYIDDGGVHHNSYYNYNTTRPQYYGAGDGSYFAGKHEVKFGFSYRRTPVSSDSMVNGNNIITIWGGYPNLGAEVQYDYVLATVGKYAQAYVTDTISMDRLTLTAGIRFDHQTSSIQPSVTPAVPNFTQFLPQVSTPAADNVYDFNNLTPRVGLTYALDDSRKTVARASYAMFASQLPGNQSAFVSTIQPYTFVYYYTVDQTANGQPCTAVTNPGVVNAPCNGLADPRELAGMAPAYSNNLSLAHPGVFTTSNKIDPNLSAPRTQEFMAGLDHELMPNFGVSATITYRYMNNFIYEPPNGVTGYKQVGTFTGTFANVGSVAVPYYSSIGTASGGGFIATNRPDYHQRYLGFEASATKRMANHWMGRLGFASTSWNEYFDGTNPIMDPTRGPVASSEWSLSGTTKYGPQVNGGPVVFQTSGSGKSNIFLLPPKYQLNANGMYQGPWGIDFGANFVMRQGYGEPFYRDRVASHDPVVNNKTLLLANAVDQFRLSPVADFDIRLEKMFKFGTTSTAIDFDVFNLFNAATTLGYQYNARVTTYNTVQEIMQPRIARLGVRFFF